MEHHIDRRVVVTGLGIVAPNGIGKKAFWHTTSNGISGIQHLQRFPTTDLPIRVGGEVSAFDATDYIDRKLADRTDRMTHFAFASVQEALQDSGIEIAREDPQRVGAVIANTFGGIEYALEQVTNLHVRGPRTMSAFTSIAWLPVASVGQISIRYGIQGYCKAPLNDTVGSLDALGLAYTTIRRSVADVIITGGCEAMVHPYMLLVLSHSNACATGDDTRAYRPFDQRAAGFLLAEGAGMCILEEYEHARRRGATIYGEIVGYGQTSDAWGFQAVTSNGVQYARAMHLALQEGQLQPEEIGYFSLDGRALPQSDYAEVDALRRTFGADLHYLPVSVPRTMLGHGFAAAGALDTIIALLAFQYGMIPPTINCEQLDPSFGLNLVRDEAQPLSRSRSTALIGGRGMTGTNVVLAIRQM